MSFPVHIWQLALCKQHGGFKDCGCTDHVVCCLLHGSKRSLQAQGLCWVVTVEKLWMVAGQSRDVTVLLEVNNCR
jgi:hypothetical protein